MKHKPKGILAITIGAIIVGVYELFTSINTIFIEYTVAIPSLILCTLLFLLAFGFLQGLWWGWYFGIGFSALNIIGGILGIGMVITTPPEKNMWGSGEFVRELLFGIFIIVINILILLYLTKPQVRDYFKKRKNKII